MRRSLVTVLGLLLRWDHGELKWWDPETDAPIPTFETERRGRLEAEQGRQAEREARLEAEVKVLELQAELAKQRDQD